ncbi:MAG: leucine-rich repeat domain-containing protein [Fibromonadaceae bacterium]|jgi:hypothetical protein|nr:leucine-rich repeat domain-containing protein [Fibromonadaceae bacterium]
MKFQVANTENGSVIIVRFLDHGISQFVDIPETIEGKPVVAIGSWVFKNHSELEFVYIPQGVVSIGEAAFWGCEKLISIDIPPSVTSIGNNAFRGCKRLPRIELPSSVTSIGKGAFEDCKRLSKIELPSFITSIEESTFVNCHSLCRIDIPPLVTSIGNDAFSSCRSLTSIDIPSSVTSIGDGAFSSCYSLLRVNIPSSVTMGQHVFIHCLALEKKEKQEKAEQEKQKREVEYAQREIEEEKKREKKLKFWQKFSPILGVIIGGIIFALLTMVDPHGSSNFSMLIIAGFSLAVGIFFMHIVDTKIVSLPGDDGCLILSFWIFIGWTIGAFIVIALVVLLSYVPFEISIAIGVILGAAIGYLLKPK